MSLLHCLCGFISVLFLFFLQLHSYKQRIFFYRKIFSPSGLWFHGLTSVMCSQSLVPWLLADQWNYSSLLHVTLCGMKMSESTVVLSMWEWGRFKKAACTLKVWEQLPENDSKVGQKAYREKACVILCRKCPKSCPSSYKSWEKQTWKYWFCLSSFFLFSSSFPSWINHYPQGVHRCFIQQIKALQL